MSQKQFICRGTITLRDATFYIKAEDLAEAKLKAKDGDFEDVEYNGAELTDWELEPTTVELNE